jgi:hypothetical protein
MIWQVGSYTCSSNLSYSHKVVVPLPLMFSQLFHHLATIDMSMAFTMLMCTIQVGDNIHCTNIYLFFLYIHIYIHTYIYTCKEGQFPRHRASMPMGTNKHSRQNGNCQ